MCHLSLEGFRIRVASQGSEIGEHVLKEVACPWVVVTEDLSTASQGVFIQSEGLVKSAEISHVRRQAARRTQGIPVILAQDLAAAGQRI